MKKVICALVMFLGACSGTGSGPGGAPDYADDLVGSYNSEIQGFLCYRLLTLNADRTFGLGTGCQLESGELAAESHRGTWSATATELSLNQTRSSCAGDTRGTGVVRYTRNMYNLTLIFDASALVFEETPPGPSSGGRIVIGCFDDAMAFVQSPERDL